MIQRVIFKFISIHSQSVWTCVLRQRQCRNNSFKSSCKIELSTLHQASVFQVLLKLGLHSVCNRGVASSSPIIGTSETVCMTCCSPLFLKVPRFAIASLSLQQRLESCIVLSLSILYEILFHHNYRNLCITIQFLCDVLICAITFSLMWSSTCSRLHNSSCRTSYGRIRGKGEGCRSKSAFAVAQFVGFERLRNDFQLLNLYPGGG